MGRTFTRTPYEILRNKPGTSKKTKGTPQEIPQKSHGTLKEPPTKLCENFARSARASEASEARGALSIHRAKTALQNLNRVQTISDTIAFRYFPVLAKSGHLHWSQNEGKLGAKYSIGF